MTLRGSARNASRLSVDPMAMTVPGKAIVHAALAARASTRYQDDLSSRLGDPEGEVIDLPPFPDQVVVCHDFGGEPLFVQQLLQIAEVS